MNEQIADAIHGQLNDYRFELNDPWDGPGDYGFALAGPEFREAFGEVSVDESATLTLDGVPIESEEPANAFPEEVVVGLFEVLVAQDAELQAYMEEHGEDQLRSIFSRHVDRLRESLIVSVHTALAGSRGSA